MGWENGRQLTSLSKQPPVVITTQPENYYGAVGGTATFTVAASGDRVTYQWQRSTNDGETWSNISGGTSTTLSVPIQASLNGYLYRCIAKDYMGHIATSQAGKLTVTSGLSTISEFEPEFTVINEPDDYYGRPGDIATFIVEAEGENLSYNWLCRAPGASNFECLTSSDATTNTLRVEMTAASNGAEYRCFITDANGDMGSTRIATVKLDILDWEMEYNTSGIRTKRVSEEKTYSYIYAGDKLMRMTVGDDVLDFSYDVNGTPLTMTYNGTAYYYITNLQGDVMRIVDGSQNTVTSYDYAPFGKVISATGTLANINPLRYRGYVYDQETGFYYLQSRYYDPTIGRFLNVDGYVSTGQGIIGHNMFAYCGNNPVINEDKTGQFFLNAAIQLLKRWLNGDGTTQYYGEKTAPVKALKRPEKMQEKVNEAILNYQNDSSNYYVRDTVEFTRDDGWNSYLAFGAVSYIITVRTETRTRGVWFWKHKQTRYVAEVIVSDFYNFDSKPWSGLGNILNNGAAILHCFGVGKDYYWEANYSYATKWEQSS